MTSKAYCTSCKTTDNLMPSPYSRYKDRGYYLCRSCNTARLKRYRTTEAGKEAVKRANQEAARKHPERRKIWKQAQTSVVTQPCQVCGASPTHRHRPDYSMPKEVVHLCPKHHKAEHRRIAEKVIS